MTVPGMLIVDVQRCIACKRCVVYCAVAHSESQELVGAMAENAAPQPRVQVRELGEYAAPYQCRHCDEPPCVDACPTDSLSKDTEGGRVLLSLETCTGEAKCVKRCSFLGIWTSGEGSQAVKCDLCIGRIEAGDIPACADACPTGAIIYKPYEELTDDERAMRSGSPGAALVRRTGIRYLIDPDKCIGCTLCAKRCPAEAVVGEKKQPHKIIQERCVTCGACYLACPKDAISALAPGDLEAAEAALAEAAPAEEAPAEEAPAAEAPAEAPPAEEPAPAEEPPAEEAPPAETQAEEAPAEEPPAEQQPSGPGRKELRRRQRKGKRKGKRAKGKKEST